MNRVVLFFLLFSFFKIGAQTLLLEENFEYTAGTNLTSNGSWSAFSGAGSSPIVISSSGLTYSGYASSGIGNSVGFSGTSGPREDDSKSFTAQSSGSLYVSFLINVTSVGTVGDYFFHLNTGTAVGRVFVKKDGSSSNIAFGVSKNSTSPNFTSFSYSTGTTYLLVIKYTFNSSNNTDDIVYLFIDPSLSGSEPSANLQALAGETDATGSLINAIALRQGANAYNVTVDGIRVSDAWSLAPLPVELSVFKGYYSNNKIILSWRTETELNNYGFEIERDDGGWKMYDGSLPAESSAKAGWQKIGFVNGNGNSNSPKEYAFEENISTSGKFLYRLKQIDFNGNFKYSEIIEVNVPAPSDFKLGQNYPNPFNPATTISFNLPKQQHVILEVFNILGQKISTLLNEIRPAGIHTVNFDASSVSAGLNSGIYVYKLTAENFVQVKKMILIK